MCVLGGCLCLYALLPPKTESSSAFLWRGCPLYLSSPGLLSRGCHVEASAAQRCLLQRPNSLTGPIPTCPDLHPTQPHPPAATRASLGSFKSSRHSSPCGPWPVPCLLRLTTRQESGQRDLLKAVTTTTCNKPLPSSVSRALGGTCGVTQPPERWPWKSRREGGGLHSSASPAWPRVNLSPSVVSLPSSRVSQAPEGGLRWVPSRAGHSSCGCSVDVTGLSNS